MLDAQPMLVADASGRAVIGTKRQAQDNNLEVGARVTLKRKRLGAKEPEAEPATITAISDEGVLVKWDKAQKNACVESLLAVSDVELALRKPQQHQTKDNQKRLRV